MKISVIEGPNLNMLGLREPNIYGNIKLEAIHEQMQKTADMAKVEIEFFQSNLEGEIVDKIQECLDDISVIIINPAAFGHTSIAIRDAISGVGIPTVEVHLSNIYAREEFRHKSMISPVCAGVITGFGPFSYHLAMISALQIANELEVQKKQ